MVLYVRRCRYLCDGRNKSGEPWLIPKLGAIEPSCNVPGSIPQWRDAVLERAKNNFETFKNHTSILFWSLGNESYAGDDIEAMNVYLPKEGWKVSSL